MFDASSLSSLSFHFTFSLQFLSTSFCSLLFKPETHTISALPSSLSQISLFPSKKKSQISFAMDSDGFVMDSFLTLSLISHLSFSFKACTRAGFGLWSQHRDRWIDVSVNHGLGGGVGLDRWRLVSCQCHQ